MKQWEFEVQGTYGSGKTETTIFVIRERTGFWYCCEDSVNVHFTNEELNDGVDIEELNDVDFFTWKEPINSLEELTEAVEA